jgi:hypothetical protein
VRADDHHDHDTADLEHMRRELAATKALGRPGPALTVITSNLDAVTAALARRPDYVPPANPEVRFQWLS